MKWSRSSLPICLALTQVLSWGVLYYSFGIFILPMKKELGWALADITGALSVAWLTSAASSMLVGRWIDRHGARKVMMIGAAIAPLLVVAWSQVHSLGSFYFVWSAIGLVMSATFYEPAFAALVQADRSDSVGTVALFAALAGFIFAPLSSRLIDLFGWRSSLLVLGTMLTIAVPLHRATLPPCRERQGPRRPSTVVDRGAVKKMVPAHLALVIAGVGLASAASVGLGVHVVPLLVAAGHDDAFAAWILGAMSLSLIPGRVLFIMARQVWSTTAVLTGALILSAGAMGLLNIADEPLAAISFGIVFGMANSIKTPALALVLAEWGDKSTYGAVSGAAGTFIRVAQGASPALLALLIARPAGYEGVVIGLAFTLVLSAAAVASGAALGSSSKTVQ